MCEIKKKQNLVNSRVKPRNPEEKKKKINKRDLFQTVHLAFSQLALVRGCPVFSRWRVGSGGVWGPTARNLPGGATGPPRRHFFARFPRGQQKKRKKKNARTSDLALLLLPPVRRAARQVRQLGGAPAATVDFAGGPRPSVLPLLHRRTFFLPSVVAAAVAAAVREHPARSKARRTGRAEAGAPGLPEPEARHPRKRPPAVDVRVQVPGGHVRAGVGRLRRSPRPAGLGYLLLGDGEEGGARQHSGPVGVRALARPRDERRQGGQDDARPWILPEMMEEERGEREKIRGWRCDTFNYKPRQKKRRLSRSVDPARPEQRSHEQKNFT
ncbi:MAG: hypothetical protein BJ554DRAFT_1683 [Olpidium bornovanus]|uniref:Uncharacterized protein n=1 Tax=Olpidium bornovanus TaxID=278681 RepID=A0A8H8DGW7_9FUNG|nr:MAG: hypothetical protein BJ554DRAFT_1683 [Olpidium bornovanus]